MIDVTLLIKKEKRLGFAIKGHANFDQHGYDIDDENEMKVSLKNSNEKSEIILNDFEIGIKTLLTNYNEYVNLNYREV